MAKKVLTGCQHDGSFLPLHAEKSLRYDSLVGWVVDVLCNKCLSVGIAAVDYKHIDWNEERLRPDINEKMYDLYGPFKEIWTGRESELLKEGKSRHILTITSAEVPYRKLPKADRPSKEELAERGETTKTYVGSMLFAGVGHHPVNREAIFESTHPMPEDLQIKDFWFDDYLKAP